LSNFGERFNELIFDKRITPDILAQAIGVDLSLIYKYLRKEFIPSTPTAIDIANYFNCSLDFLFGLSEESPNVFNTKLEPFSARFQQMLLAKNCTRYRLKKETQLAKQSVDDWFHGKRVPTIDNLIILAQFFDCSIDYLIGREK
ncbi:MAG: helix-turn-helix transcriptional regulator, partial [Clostridia bacterium]